MSNKSRAASRAIAESQELAAEAVTGVTDSVTLDVTAEDVRLTFIDGVPHLSKPRLYAPIERDQWSPALVREWLRRAYRWRQATGGRVRPAGYRSNMPAYVHEFADQVGQADAGTLFEGRNRIRIPASAEEVAFFEAVLEWPQTYITGPHLKFRGPLLADLRARAERGIDLKAALADRGLGQMSIATAKRWRDRAESLISVGLDRDGVPVR